MNADGLCSKARVIPCCDECETTVFSLKSSRGHNFFLNFDREALCLSAGHEFPAAHGKPRIQKAALQHQGRIPKKAQV
jgi:hypothetical protein